MKSQDRGESRKSDRPEDNDNNSAFSESPALTSLARKETGLSLTSTIQDFS